MERAYRRPTHAMPRRARPLILGDLPYDVLARLLDMLCVADLHRLRLSGLGSSSPVLNDFLRAAQRARIARLQTLFSDMDRAALHANFRVEVPRGWDHLPRSKRTPLLLSAPPPPPAAKLAARHKNQSLQQRQQELQIRHAQALSPRLDLFHRLGPMLATAALNNNAHLPQAQLQPPQNGAMHAAAAHDQAPPHPAFAFPPPVNAHPHLHPMFAAAMHGVPQQQQQPQAFPPLAGVEMPPEMAAMMAAAMAAEMVGLAAVDMGDGPADPHTMPGTEAAAAAAAATAAAAAVPATVADTAATEPCLDTLAAFVSCASASTSASAEAGAAAAPAAPTPTRVLNTPAPFSPAAVAETGSLLVSELTSELCTLIAEELPAVESLQNEQLRPWLRRRPPRHILPSTLGDCVQLRRLTLRDWRFTSLPSCLLRLHNLEELSLERVDALASLPQDMGTRLPHLVFLQILSCALRSVPASVLHTLERNFPPSTPRLSKYGVRVVGAQWPDTAYWRRAVDAVRFPKMSQCVHDEFGAFAPWGELDRMRRAVDANQIDNDGAAIGLGALAGGAGAFGGPAFDLGADEAAAGFVEGADGDGWIVWHLR